MRRGSAAAATAAAPSRPSDVEAPDTPGGSANKRWEEKLKHLEALDGRTSDARVQAHTPSLVTTHL